MKVNHIFEDLKNYELPKDIEKLNVIQCKLTNGNRIFWYYQEDVEYAKECDRNEDDLIKDPPYSGILITIPYQENNGEYEYDQMIVVIDDYPCEKSYPETAWIALNRFIDDDNIIQVFDKND